MSRSNASEPSLELVQLVGAALEGDVSESEMGRLKELLRADPDARRYYLDAAAMHSMLEWEHGEAELLGFSAPGSTAKNGSGTKRVLLVLGAAAMLVLGALLSRLLAPPASPQDLASDRKPDLAEGSPRLHARLTAVEGPEWEAGRPGMGHLALGEWVPDGNLRLKSGRVTLTFDSGAVLSAEGPVEFDVEGPNRGFLHHGKVAAFVPPQATGFVLNTPSSSIIDLGTRFGAIVHHDGSTEVHVVEGDVEVADLLLTSGGEPRLLKAGEALVVGRSGEVADVRFDGELFAGSFEELTEAPPLDLAGFVHWPFDEGQGRTTRGRASSGDEYVGVLEGGRSGEGRWAEGVWGKGLALDGDDDWVSTDYLGVAGRSPRTVAFWINLPPIASGNEVPAILTWGGFDRIGAKWELVPNPYGHNGAIGALRLSCKQGFVVGTTDIQNGRWHHVAVVYSGGSGADIFNHVKIYIDGKLDPVSGFLRGPIDTTVGAGSAIPLTIGRYCDPTQPLSGHLRGAIDELYIFDGALTPQHIGELARRPE